MAQSTLESPTLDTTSVRRFTHELNNALTPCLLIPELLLQTLPPTSPLRENLNEIKQSILRATRIIKTWRDEVDPPMM